MKKLLLLSMIAFGTHANAQTAPNLGRAANFGMLAGQSAQSSANTNVLGDAVEVTVINLAGLTEQLNLKQFQQFLRASNTLPVVLPELPALPYIKIPPVRTTISTLTITKPNAYISGISMKPNERQEVAAEFNITSKTAKVGQYTYDLTQKQLIAGAYQLMGGERYEINYDPCPKPGISFSKTGNTTKLSTTAPTGEKIKSLQWLLNGTNIAGATAEAYIAKENGNYSAAVVLKSGCNAVTDIVNVQVGGNGRMEKATESALSLHPNPNDGSMTLEYTLQSGDTGTFELMELTGRTVATYKLAAENTMLNIQEPSLTHGMYFYRVTVNGEIVKTDKVIISK